MSSINVTPELLSLYADGVLENDQALAVEAALAADPALAELSDEFLGLNELFGIGPVGAEGRENGLSSEPEPISDALAQRLYALKPVAELATFEPVKMAPVRRVAWGQWAAVAAALVMVVFGVRALTHRSPVTLHDFARLSLDATGDVAHTHHRTTFDKRAGDELTTKASERVSFRLADGSMVVLLPNSQVSIGEPNQHEMLTVERGTVLFTVNDHEDPRLVTAGPYVLHTRGASFGVNVSDEATKAMGPSTHRGPRVSVTVRRGSLSVVNGETTTLRDYERVVMQDGKAVERGHASSDPHYGDLMRVFSSGMSREVMPGYFATERGVTVIPRTKWERSTRRGAHGAGGRSVRTFAVTDAGRGAALARYLVVHVRVARPTALELSFVRPSPEEPGVADVVTAKTDVVGAGWTVLAIPRAILQSEDAVKSTRRIPTGRSQLVRFELASADPSISFELKSSLWAERAPTTGPVDNKDRNHQTGNKSRPNESDAVGSKIGSKQTEKNPQNAGENSVEVDR